MGTREKRVPPFRIRTSYTIDGNLVESAYDDNSNVIERLETNVTKVIGVASENFRTTFIYDSLDRLQTSRAT